MIEFAISLQNDHTILFYSAIILAVILEGPITVLLISLFAQKFGFSYIHVLIFAFIGDVGGDILHFGVGRVFTSLHDKLEKNKKFNAILKRIHSYSLVDKLMVIKYTPAVTNVGLLYLGASKLTFKDFIKTDIIFCLASSIVISFIGYYFGSFLGDTDDFVYIFIALGITFATFYFGTKLLYKFLLRNK